MPRQNKTRAEVCSTLKLRRIFGVETTDPKKNGSYDVRVARREQFRFFERVFGLYQERAKENSTDAKCSNDMRSYVQG